MKEGGVGEGTEKQATIIDLVLRCSVEFPVQE